MYLLCSCYSFLIIILVVEASTHRFTILNSKFRTNIEFASILAQTKYIKDRS
jgi:hypothetical protein